MAKSGSLSTAYRGWTYKIEWSASQSIDNNQSVITCVHKLVMSSTYGLHIGSRTNTCSVGGVSKSFTSPSISNDGGATITLGTTKHTVSHNSDGTKSVTVRGIFNIDAELSGVQKDNITVSGTITLDTIPRKSTLSVGNGTLDTEQTLTVTRKSTSFTHTIVATCGSASKPIVTNSSSTNIKFTPPIEWASQNTSGTSVSVKYTITTYNGSTNIGSNSYTKTCSIPSKVKPSCVIAVTDPTGYLDTYGKAIKGLSKFKVVVTPTISYGSAISSYKVTANGSTYTKASFTTDVLKSSGTLNVNATVTDKRGRTSNTATASVGVYNYVAPSISKLTVTRCDENGKSNSSGAFLAVKFSASVTSLDDQNTATYKVQYKKTTDTEYNNPVALTDYKNKYSVSDGVYVFSAVTTSSYDIILTVTDKFKSANKTGTGSSIKKVWSMFKKGLGFAFGKVAELEDFLDIAFFTRFRKDLYLDNNIKIYGADLDGNYKNTFHGQNEYGNTVVGFGNYDIGKGNTNIYGNDVNIASAEAGKALYRPYFRKGDSITLTWTGGGYVSSSSKNIYFTIPLSKPVIGSPTVTVASLYGIILRQNDGYTHGSSGDTYAKPSSYSASLSTDGQFVRVTATMSATTNATNNDAIGILWNGTITFS